MVALYSSTFAVYSDRINSIEFKGINVNENGSIISRHIEKDIRINRLKGVAYSYLLASQKILSPTVVSLKKLSNDMRNILSSVLSSPDGRPSVYQQQQLAEIYKRINDEFYKANGAYAKIQEALTSLSEKYSFPRVAEFLQSEGLWEFWKAGISQKLGLQRYHIDEFYCAKNDNKLLVLDSYIKTLNSRITAIEKSSDISIHINELPHIFDYDLADIPGQKTFVTKLIKSYVDSEYSKDSFIQSRYEFAKFGGNIFKTEMGDKWNPSPERDYVNSLLRNLNEFTPFNINGTKNLTLKSFAAFCQKGDTDIDKLDDYLLANEIGDPRIAFALWGAIFGFAELPKTLTDQFYKSHNKEYVAAVYKAIFKSLHGVYIDKELVFIEKTTVDENPLKMAIDTIPLSIKERERVDNALDVEMRIGDKVAFLYILNNVLNPRTIAYKGLKNQLCDEKYVNKGLKESVNEILYSLHLDAKQMAEAKDKCAIAMRLEEKVGDAEALVYILDDMNVSAKAQKAIKEHFGIGSKTPVSKIRVEPKEIIEQDNLFNQQSSTFYMDESAFYRIKSHLPQDAKSLEDFREDLEWFQREYQKGKDSMWYGQASHDNNNVVIDSFQRYLSKKDRRAYSRKINILSIISALKSIYL